MRIIDERDMQQEYSDVMGNKQIEAKYVRVTKDINLLREVKMESTAFRM
jgi:hypothetical protein